MAIFNKNYALTAENIDIFAKELSSFILEKKLDKRVAVKTRLTAELVLLDWLEKLPKESCFEVEVKKFWGRFHVILKAKGKQLGDVLSQNSDDDFHKAMLVNLETVYTQSYGDGYNIFDIKLPRPQLGGMGKVLLASVAAIIIGQLMLFLLPQDTLLMFNDKLIKPFFGTVMRVLGATATFMIFTSIVVSVSCMQSINVLKTIGRDLFMQHFKLLNLFAAISLVFCIGFFNVLSFDGGLNGAVFLQIYNMLLNIVPNDFITPFVQGNTLQIVFMALVSGIVILILDSEVVQLKNIAIQLNRFFQFILISICELMPLIIFLSILQLVITNSVMLALQAWKLIFAEAVLTAIVWLVYMWQVKCSSGKAIGQVIKDFVPLTLFALSTCSTIACLKTSEELLLKKYNIKKSLVDFCLPMGLILSKPGFAVDFIVLVFGYSEMCGHQVNIGQALTLFLTSAVFALAVPPVPGGMIAFLNVLFTQYNVPAEMLCIAIAANFVFDMLQSVIHVIGNPAEIVVLDKRLNKE